MNWCVRTAPEAPRPKGLWGFTYFWSREDFSGRFRAIHTLVKVNDNTWAPDESLCGRTAEHTGGVVYIYAPTFFAALAVGGVL